MMRRKTGSTSWSCARSPSRRACVVLAARVRSLCVSVAVSDVPAADRRPIDPPPIVQLRVIDPAATDRRRRDRLGDSQSGSPAPSSSSTLHDDDSMDSYAQSFLQNPYYFMFASLAKPDDDAELHWLKVCLISESVWAHITHLGRNIQDGRTRCTTGSVVSSLYHLKDPQNNNEGSLRLCSAAWVSSVQLCFYRRRLFRIP